MTPESRLTITPQVKSTPEFNFVFGRYQLSRWSIPYFSTVMSIEDAATSLKTVSEFPGWEHEEWALEELFQREVDGIRVEKKILPYLRNADSPQFFNSITIALLPLKKNKFVVYEDPELVAPKMDAGADKKVINVGPLAVGYFNEWKSIDDDWARFGRLKWNPDHAFCAAIDGQHRLAALKALREAKNADVSGPPTHVPVIIVVFDERVGFVSPSEQPDHVKLLRGLFIDLNKHAAKVSRSRLILLDDADPVSVCVRRLVGNKLRSGFEDLEESPPKMPLALIDWHSDAAKFDEGPYVATILGLDWVVQQAVGIKVISDYMDHASVRKQLRKMEKEFEVSLTAAHERLDHCENEKFRIFNFSTEGAESDLELLSDGFSRTWAPAIVHILTQLSPYKRLILFRQKDDVAASVEFAQWYELTSRADSDSSVRKNQLYHLQTRMSEGEITAARCEQSLHSITRLKEEGGLAFNVVFQRALFYAFGRIRELDARDLTSGGGLDASEEGSIEDEFYEAMANLGEEGVSVDFDDVHGSKMGLLEVAIRFVNSLNRLISNWPGFLQVRESTKFGDGGKGFFWLGTIWKPEGSIDFTLGASQRARPLIVIAVAMEWMVAGGEIPDHWSWDDFLREVMDGSLDSPLAKLIRRCSNDLTNKSGNSKSAASRMVSNPGPDSEESKELEIQEVRRRLRVLFDAARGPI